MQTINDGLLILVVALLVAIDLTIIIIFTLYEGIQGSLGAELVTHKEKPTTTEGVSN